MAVFVVCGTPSLIVNIVEAVRQPNDINFTRFLVVANLLVVVNSACNFLIYCMLGKRFRSKLIDLCRCCVCTPDAATATPQRAHASQPSGRNNNHNSSSYNSRSTTSSHNYRALQLGASNSQSSCI